MKFAALLAASAVLAAAPALAQTTGAPSSGPQTVGPQPAPASRASQVDIPQADPNMVDPTPEQAKAAEDAVRAAIEEFRSGKIDYSTMTDELHTQIEPQAERIKTVLAGVGEIKTLRAVIRDKEQNVTFLRAEFTNGAAFDFAVQLAPDGKLAQLALRPAQD
jgi:hypothetical protein